MSTPIWALTLAYWAHMLATVAWLGGLAAISLLVIPAARRTLEPAAYATLLGRLQQRLDPLGWLSLAVLAGTGMFQMSANPNYSGFLAVDNRWAYAILIKHLVIFGMVGVSAFMTWGVMPALRRAALLQAHGRPDPRTGWLSRREENLLRLNLFLGMMVLALTALARAS